MVAHPCQQLVRDEQPLSAVGIGKRTAGKTQIVGTSQFPAFRSASHESHACSSSSLRRDFGWRCPVCVLQVVRQQEAAVSLKPRSARRPPAACDLVCVEVQPCDAGTGGLRDVDQRPADSPSGVGDLGARPQIQEFSHADLLTALRGVESSPGSPWCEVEGLPPTVLVEPPHHLRSTPHGTIAVLSRG